ncbi:MAG TPA: GTP 3',8-cyclase MoaA [Syntrophaceae bacterium]|jgi:cyclic pyranopterin phosphate synthase|nr:GTP 3',8-cyclase MoaA [Syntrophaceae bacterium]
MLDTYNREINYLRVSITDRCNLRCRYCMPKEGVSLLGHDDILKYEEILRIIGVAVTMGISKIRITGGEPLVRRGVVDFVASVNAMEGIRDVSLTTNGTLLEAFAAKLFTAGIKRINISLDSLDPAKYAQITRGGELGKVLAGIEEVYRIGFAPIKINTVAITGFNDDEIVNFANLSLHKPYQIRFIELMTIGHAALDNNGRYLSNMLIKEVIERHYRLEPVGSKKNSMDGPAQIYRIAGAAGEIGFISPLSHKFCHACNRLRLMADGHLRACLLTDEEVDLKGPIRGGCSDADLSELIQGAIVKKPLHHDISCDEGHRKKCMTDMSSIGG